MLVVCRPALAVFERSHKPERPTAGVNLVVGLFARALGIEQDIVAAGIANDAPNTGGARAGLSPEPAKS